ncbi:hypothetical protein [Flavihumibacter fluvii]|uniref:hypothetical protein n=1 Tax=Flavihumibacter fluvii TaxID=2838157 RepID=UPI001BDE5E72|nr:hypothetical protein [Flavihumibacter fluvii]ULQ52711.1 hypothetical protein KJS93_00045 [Flavihumibacter fluvii]
MNKKQPYELTITEKLEQLTVPDMVDAIWARIETQLDIDMPTDDGPPEPPTTPTTGPGKWISAVFFIALITILFTQFYNRQKNKDISIDQPVINIPNTPVGNDPKPLNNSPGNISGGKKAVKNNKGGPALLSDPDSTTVNNAVPENTVVVVDDSNRAVQPNTGSDIGPPAALENKGDSIKKKSRGVKGINDGDYRIVPKKDSGG